MCGEVVVWYITTQCEDVARTRGAAVGGFAMRRSPACQPGTFRSLRGSALGEV
jgi:hypothetical protein